MMVKQKNKGGSKRIDGFGLYPDAEPFEEEPDEL